MDYIDIKNIKFINNLKFQIFIDEQIKNKYANLYKMDKFSCNVLVRFWYQGKVTL